MTAPQSRYAAVRARAEAAGQQPADQAERPPPVPDTARAVISFTYTVLSGWGLLRNPHIAVWVEDLQGHLVRTVSVTDREGVNTMAQWYEALGTTETTTSSTKPAGSHSVEWDLTSDDGTRVPEGDYYVCIEASRDEGPYELILHRVSFGTKPGMTYLPSSGELAAAAVIYRV